MGFIKTTLAVCCGVLLAGIVCGIGTLILIGDALSQSQP